jgi:hypothetical protein
VAKDLPELRVEAGPGGYFLFAGEEKIGPYTVRAAAEQVIVNWRARRANGETDDQIRSTGGHRPTKPVPGVHVAAIGGLAASGSAVAALRAEIAALEAKLTPTRSEAKPLYRQSADELIAKYGRHRPQGVKTKSMLTYWRSLHPADDESTFWRALREELGWSVKRRKKQRKTPLLANPASNHQ